MEKESRPESQPPAAWFEATNEQFRAKGVPPARRPFEAWRSLALESGVPLALSDPAVQRIFQWFRQHSKHGSGQVGTLFEGVYFFDATFWLLIVPYVAGTVELRPEQALSDMPPAVLRDLLKEPESREEFQDVWRDTIDYALAIGGLLQAEEDQDTLGFLRAADRELREAAVLLLQRNHDANAAQASRSALEMIAKWFLRRTENASMTWLKKVSHNIMKLLRACRRHLPPGSLNSQLQAAKKMPPVAARYSAARPEPAILWSAYRTALSTCAVLVRTKGLSPVQGAEATPILWQMIWWRVRRMVGWVRSQIGSRRHRSRGRGGV